MTKRDSDSAAFQTNPGKEEATGAIAAIDRMRFGAPRPEFSETAWFVRLEERRQQQFSIGETQTTILQVECKG